MTLAELTSPANISTAFIGINFAAFAAFGIDKIKAEAGSWRIAESTLLMLALVGGTAGAYAGRKLFRHKTRKQPFSKTLHSIAIQQTFALTLGAGWFLAG